MMTRWKKRRETSPPQKFTKIVHLPQEIIAEILSFLPVKTLIKFRLILRYTNYNLNPYVYYLLSCPIPNYDSINPNAVVAHDYPSKDPHVPVSIIGSCNGLVCIKVRKVGFFIWNPSTRKSKKLPVVGIKSGRTLWNNGFGYDQFNSDYKLVQIMSVFRVGVFSGDELRIYSLKNDSWRKIGNFPHNIPRYDLGKYVDGKLYWKVVDVRACNRSICILSLDLGTETCGEIAQPCYGDGINYNLGLGVLEGCLSVFCYCDSACGKKPWVDIWVMKEYGARGPWLKLYTIAYGAELVDGPCFPLCISMTGEILFVTVSRLVLYNPNNNRFRNLNVGNWRGFFEETTYVESLVSPVIYDEVPSP